MEHEPSGADRPAVIDAYGIHGLQRFSGAVGALIDAIDCCGCQLPALAVLGSHGFAVCVAIASGLRRGRRLVFLDSATDLSRMGKILGALDVTIVLDCVGAAPVALPGIKMLDVRTLLVDCDATKQGSAAPLTCHDYAILTSGTTGEAKVIVQTLPNLRAHIDNYVEYVGVGLGDRVLQLASAGWDAGLMDLFACLFHGAVLCSIDPRVHDLTEVRRFIAEHDVNVLHMTVPYFRLIHADPELVYPAPRRLVIGGDLIVAGDIERFDRAVPDSSTLYNAYGPTECTTVLYNVHRRGEPMEGATWPLAFAVPGVEVELALTGKRVRSADLTGELVVKSALIARRFDVAARRAVSLDDEVFGDGVGYYVTGDLAHRDDAGRIVITGRKDSLVKVNGQKVSLHEIETVLRSLAGVSDTCVVVEAGEPGALVIAAVVPTDASVEMATLRRALAARLPAHKLPKQLLLLNSLPLNKNNKIDRQQILAFAAAERAAARGALADGDMLLAEIQRVLRGAPIDPTLSFVENGGDSLRALSVVSALKRKGHRTSLDQLLSTTPVGALVVDGSASERPAARPPQNSDVTTDREQLALPNRAFLEGRGISDLDRWSQAAVFDYAGARDTTELAKIAQAVLARHTVTWPGRSPSVQVVEGPPFAETVRALSQRISLAEGRIVEAEVIVDTAGVHLAVACHQFYIDRASWLVLLAEIAEGVRDGTAAVRAWPAPAPDQLGWIALYQQYRRNELASEIWDELPWDRCRDLVAATPLPVREAFRRFTIELTGAASRGALAHVDHALLAAVLIGLADLTGCSFQKIDILGHGRDVVAGGFDAAGIVGWFTVIYPFVLEVSVDAPTAVVRAVASLRTRLSPVAHTFGNEHYRRGTRWRCDASYNFIGDLELASTGELAVNAFSIQTMHGAASHPLELTGYRSGPRIQLVIDHDPNAIDTPSIERLAAGIGRAFTAIEVA